MIGDRRPIVVAHRGGAAEAPENTIEAFKRAIRLGYPGVEFDVRMSRDGVAVVVHDKWVRPTPEGRSRPVHGLTAAELARFPRLDDVLALPWGRTVLMVEIKAADLAEHDRAIGPLASRAIVARGLASQAIVASFSREILVSASKAVPEVPIMALIDAQQDETGFDGLSLFGWGEDIGYLDHDLVKYLKQGSREVWTWTVKTLDHMRQALDAGVDGLITDIPGEVLRHV